MILPGIIAASSAPPPSGGTGDWDAYTVRRYVVFQRVPQLTTVRRYVVMDTS